jgi:hypothetical protein
MNDTRTLRLLAGTVLALALLNSFVTPVVRATVTAVSYWRMGENDPGVAAGTATNTTDPTGGRTLTLRGAPSYSSGVSPAAATLTGSAWCMSFTTGSYGTNAVIPLLTNNFGIELWVKPNDTTGNKSLAYNGNTGSSGWGLYQIGATYQGLFGGVAFFGSGTAAAGIWAHVALVRNNGTNTLYVNGAAAGTATTAPPNPAVGLFAMGAAAPDVSVDRYGGYLDEVRVFTFAAGAFSTNDLLLTPQPPTVTTLAATGLSATNATLNGTVNPGGAAATAYFQYGPTTGYGLFSVTNNLTATNTASAVSDLISSLSPGTPYHFRIVAANSAGSVTGSDLTFTSSVAAPTATTLAATGVSATNAMLNGAVNPDGLATTVYFQYGTDTNYANFNGTIPNPSFESNTYSSYPGYASGNGGVINGWSISDPTWIGLNPAGSSPFADNGATPDGANVAFIQSNGATNTLSTTISNLAAGKTYVVSFRANCRTGGGAFNATWSLNGGSFMPFTAGPPVGSANAYYTNSASFTATASTAALVLQNFSAGDTTVLLDAFSVAPLIPGEFSATNMLAATNTTFAVSNLISGLQPVTTYYFQVVATNSAGRALGANQSFTTPAAAPTVTTVAATGIGATNAALNGTVNPNGLATAAYFQYGLTTSYGSFSATNILTATNITLSVSNLIGGLSPGTLYHFQAVATNSAGSSLGADQTFMTAGAAPTATTLTANGLNGTNATLNGAVNPNGLATTAYFQYGPDTNYGSFSATNTLAATNITLAVSNLISGLSPSTLYHFQIVATNSAGSVTGADLTFTTPVTAPTATTAAATSVSAFNATFNGSVNPNGLATAAYFQYGLTTSYGSFSATNSLTATNIIFAVSNLISGLSPGTLYHFQVVATNSSGSVTGGDLTFTTAPVNPTAITLAATGVTATNATLNGTVNPGSGLTAAYFQYGQDTNNVSFSATIPNPSFEANHYTVSPGYANVNGGVISGWTISNTSRIGLNPSGSSLFADNGATPDGANVAFIQSNGGANSLSTTISNLVVGEAYQVSFRANCRSGYGPFTATWSLNGGSFVPFTASPSVGGTNAYYTNSASFIATANTAALILQNSSAGDTTVLLDAFSIVPTLYGGLSTVTNLSATSTDQSVSSLVSGLLPGVTYHFQIVASNSAGSAFGADLTFTTSNAAPTVATLAASGVTTTNATLNGTVIPNGEATTAYYQYGTDTNYGSFSATTSLAASYVTFTVTNLINSLSPGTLYHFQLVASNSTGSATGADQIFTMVRLPITFNITNAGDNGPGTLRQAILDSISGDTISFDASLSGSSILLTSGQLVLTDNLTIDASALPGGLQINGNGSSRIMQVNNGATVVLTALTLNNGGGVVSGGGIFNSGTLTLNRCTLAGNSAVGPAGSAGANGVGYGSSGYQGGDGGPGAGGALYNTGTLTVNECTLAANLAKGGNGGRGGNGGPGLFGNGGNGGYGGNGGTGTGGAIYNTGLLAVNQCTLAANTASGGSAGGGGSGGSPGGSNGGTGTAGSGTAGGIYQTSTLNLFNSIVAGNTPDNLVGSVVATGNNLTSGTPLLSALGNNGGPTPTMLLLAGSPAFDAGASTAFTTDQRGFARVLGNAPDIGAVEMAAATVFTLPASNVNSATATLNGTVNPNGVAAAAFFQYGTTTNYGSYSSTNALIITNVTLAVAGAAVNLLPATTYHYRIVATNGIGLIRGPDMTFTTAGAAPAVTTAGASGLSANNATLNGAVNPNGLTTAAYFQYGLTTSYGSFSGTNSLTATNITLPVSSLISGLSPGTLYHFEVVAANSGGSVTGGDLTFTTAPVSPTAVTLAATGISGTSAVLNGTVNPGSGVTTTYFRYGPDTNYANFNGTIPNPSFEANNYTVSPGYASGNGGVISGWTISNTSRIGLNPASGNAFANNGATPDGGKVAFIQSNADTNTLSTTITGLLAGKTYVVSFRANCRSGYGPFTATWSLNGGSFVPFTAGPSVGGTNAYYTNSASFTATTNTAALALRNTSAGDTAVLLDAFSVAPLIPGGFSATNILAATNTDQAVSNLVSGLLPATTYHFQIVAVNSAGTATGADLTFATGVAPPTVATLAATGVTATNATFNGAVNPNGNVATAYFQYGMTTNYGSFSATNSLPVTNMAVAVSNLINGLAPATPYHFQIVANNSGNSTTGADQTFTTSNAAPTITPMAAIILATNAANGFLSVQLSAAVNPNGSTTAAYFEYGLTTAYAASNNFASVPAGNQASILAATNLFSAGFTYHWHVVATNSVGSTVLPDQTFSLGMLGSGGLAGDLNGDGVVSLSELQAVYANYVTNSPWLYMTNVAGLGGTNVSFSLNNSISGGYTVQYSTNLVDWLPLGPATPLYLFTDTNAPAGPHRYYRLSYP